VVAGVRVDVLVPSLGYGRFIESALATIQGQAHVGSIIVADGGSTDDTLERLSRRQETNVEVLYGPDRGQSHGLNRALAVSDGDLVGWLNADDLYLPGAFEAVVRTFTAEPDLDVVHGDFVIVDEGSRVLRMVAGYPVDDRVLDWRGCVIPSCATFVRRAVLEGWSFDEDLKTIMDWDFFLGLRRRTGAWAHVSRPLAAFRRHDAQVTSAAMSRSSEEHRRVSERYDLAPRTAVRRLLGDTLHRLHKARSGAYATEWRCRRSLRASRVLELPTWRLEACYGKRAGEVHRSRW
jgi:glycosyltransferase involved in cell wall biosynthesis